MIWSCWGRISHSVVMFLWLSLPGGHEYLENTNVRYSIDKCDSCTVTQRIYLDINFLEICFATIIHAHKAILK